jgi:hypothetical protein
MKFFEARGGLIMLDELPMPPPKILGEFLSFDVEL